MSTTVHKHKMVITHPAYLWLMGTMELRRVDICVICIWVYLFFMGLMKGEKTACMCVKSWMVLAMGLKGCLCMRLCVCVRVFRMSLSIGVHTALLGHDGHLLHQNYHCRPLSSLRLLSLGSCRNLSGRLPLHLPKWQDSQREQAASTRVPEIN